LSSIGCLSTVLSLVSTSSSGVSSSSILLLTATISVIGSLPLITSVNVVLFIHQIVYANVNLFGPDAHFNLSYVSIDVCDPAPLPLELASGDEHDLIQEFVLLDSVRICYSWSVPTHFILEEFRSLDGHPAWLFDKYATRLIQELLIPKE